VVRRAARVRVVRFMVFSWRDSLVYHHCTYCKYSVSTQ
jgi:hypothetical protein